MPSIRDRLAALFGHRKRRKVLLLGLDAAGKTTILYRLKWGEVVTTIPTIGLVVETVTHRGVEVVGFDVGAGCGGKWIRRLWRHFYVGTDVVLFCVNSIDRDRFGEASEELVQALEGVKDVVKTEGIPVGILATHQDFVHCMSVGEVEGGLNLGAVGENFNIKCFGVVGTTGKGLREIMDWIVNVPLGTKIEGDAQGQEEEKEKEGLEKWLDVEDEDDDEFLEKLSSYKLETWDHRTHLRIAWLYLTREGRQKGMESIFSSIKAFIENSAITKRSGSRGTTFHITMTYFWSHMVHFAIVSHKAKADDFKTFLLLNPQLSNGGLFLFYYTKELMFNSPEARSTVVLPDKNPLPSLLSDVGEMQANTVIGPAESSSTGITDD